MPDHSPIAHDLPVATVADLDRHGQYLYVPSLHRVRLVQEDGMLRLVGMDFGAKLLGTTCAPGSIPVEDYRACTPEQAYDILTTMKYVDFGRLTDEIADVPVVIGVAEVSSSVLPPHLPDGVLDDVHTNDEGNLVATVAAVGPVLAEAGVQVGDVIELPEGDRDLPSAEQELADLTSDSK